MYIAQFQLLVATDGTVTLNRVNPSIVYDPVGEGLVEASQLSAAIRGVADILMLNKGTAQQYQILVDNQRSVSVSIEELSAMQVTIDESGPDVAGVIAIDTALSSALDHLASALYAV
jgi:hypothetical protein